MPSLLTLTLTLLIALILAVTASPGADSVRDMTNAERFARGLHPKTPRRLYAGSQVDTARQARRSAVPPGTTFSCLANMGNPQATCCTFHDVDFSSGEDCYYNDGLGAYNANCAAGLQGLCCAAIAGGVDGLYSGIGCIAAAT